MKRTMIGYATCRSDLLKKQYRPKIDLIAIKIYKIKKTKEIQIEIMSLKKSFAKMFPLKTKKISKKLQKELDDPNYRVDTSDWVKPDEESIQNELIKQLVMCELYEQENTHHHRASAKRDVLYSILHTTSPSNPQGLTNYSLGDDIVMAYRELGNKKKLLDHQKMWDDILANKKSPKQNRKTIDNWIKKTMKGIINNDTKKKN